jgi:hypothetical protein
MTFLTFFDILDIAPVWSQTIKRYIRRDFHATALTDDEAADSFDLRTMLDMFAVFARFEALSQLKTRVKSKSDMDAVDAFKVLDLVSLNPRVKPLYVFSYMKVLHPPFSTFRMTRLTCRE